MAERGLHCRPAACYANAIRRLLSTPRSLPRHDERTIDQSGDDLWVFGYGSLMWRPGFDFLERRQRAAGGRASRALRLFLRPPRHAGKAGPGARARPRRQLPRHRLPGRGGEARPKPSTICARASRSRMVYREAWRRGLARRRSAAARAGALLHGRPRPPAICRPAHASTSNCITCGRATAAPATTATTCWRR